MSHRLVEFESGVDQEMPPHLGTLLYLVGIGRSQHRDRRDVNWNPRVCHAPADERSRRAEFLLPSRRVLDPSELPNVPRRPRGRIRLGPPYSRSSAGEARRPAVSQASVRACCHSRGAAMNFSTSDRVPGSNLASARAISRTSRHVQRRWSRTPCSVSRSSASGKMP